MSDRGTHNGEVTQLRSTSAAVVVLVTLLVATVSGCGDGSGASPPGLSELATFEVELADPAIGASPESPLPFPVSPVPVSVRIRAIDGRGDPIPSYRGAVGIQIVPGELADERAVVLLRGEGAQVVDVPVRFAFGETTLWVEEIGLDAEGQCSDGRDNDRDGRIDYPADPGCLDRTDPSEGRASYATGVSPPIYFARPRIRDVQRNPDEPAGDSPLLGDEVKVDGGEMVVTNVVLNGFYVTDVAEPDYGSIFLFTFGFPEGVRIGDRMCEISGGVEEFVGMTQLTFPSWERDGALVGGQEAEGERHECGDRLPLPDPVEISPADLGAGGPFDPGSLEPLEAGVATIRDAEVTTLFLDCDRDGDGDLAGEQEIACRDRCQDDIFCTEFSGFREFRQFGVVKDGVRFEVANAERITGFDVLDGCQGDPASEDGMHCPPRTLRRLTGTLRHIRLTSTIQLWVFEPRFADDIETDESE